MKMPEDIRNAHKWVLLYVLTFFILNMITKFVFSGGLHRSQADQREHFLIRGFRDDGHAYHSAHCYSPGESEVYSNGGRKYKEGKHLMDFGDCDDL
jgi:hypothetical protein